MKCYVYALVEIDFFDDEEKLSGCPRESYFYVGITDNPKRRKQAHKSQARCGSPYAYHEKIRSLNSSSWDLVVLHETTAAQSSDLELRTIVELRAQGHQLLNLKRGNSGLERLGQNKSGPVNSVTLGKNQEKKRLKQEGASIAAALKFEGVDEQNGYAVWNLLDEVLFAERGMKKRELIPLLTPTARKTIGSLESRIFS